MSETNFSAQEILEIMRTGAWEGPTRVVQEALADGWRLVEAFDMTSVLTRAK